jgi:P27 family predicted phage terminase small subunit
MRLKFEIPESYHPEAKNSMGEIFKILVRNKGVEKRDFPALNLMAYSYHIYFQSRDLLLRDGIMIEDQQQTNQPTLPGMEPNFITKLRASKPHPALKLCNDAQNQIARLLVEFNLTPRSRKKTIDLNLLPDVEDSPIDKFVSKNPELR